MQWDGRGEAGSRQRGSIYTIMMDTAVAIYCRNQYNTVKQLSSNLKKFFKFTTLTIFKCTLTFKSVAV